MENMKILEELAQKPLNVNLLKEINQRRDALKNLDSFVARAQDEAIKTERRLPRYLKVRDGSLNDYTSFCFDLLMDLGWFDEERLKFEISLMYGSQL